MPSYLGLGDGLGLSSNSLSLEFLDGSERRVKGRSVRQTRVDDLVGDENVDGLDGDLVSERSALDLGCSGVFGIELLEKVVPEPVKGPLVVVVGGGRDVSGFDGVFGGNDRSDGDVLGDGLLSVLNFGDFESGGSFDNGGVGNGLVFCEAASRVSSKETCCDRIQKLTVLSDSLRLDGAAQVVDVLLAGQEVERVPVLLVIALPRENAREQGVTLGKVSRVDGGSLFRGGCQGDSKDGLREVHVVGLGED